MSNRKKATEWFIQLIDSMNPGNDNVAMYTELLNEMSNGEFQDLMDKIADGSTILPYYSYNLDSNKLDKGTLLKVGTDIGIDFFQKLHITDEVSGTTYLSNDTYLVMYVPVRRQSQHLTKGKSVAVDHKSTDALTGQATGKSRTSLLSLPEVMILESAGHVKSIEELMKVRGGDIAGFSLAKRELIDKGEFTLSQVEDLGSTPTSTETLRAFLLGMHIDNNL